MTPIGTNGHHTTGLLLFRLQYCTTRNYTPHELIFGKLPYLPNDNKMANDNNYNLDEYANELQARQ